MTKFFSTAAIAAISMLLAACGGSSFTSSSSSGGAATGALSAISVSSSSTSLPADGSATATITAAAADANGKPITGAAITFASDSNSAISPTQMATDSSGNATATLSIGTAAPGAAIKVTATSGSISGTTTVTVGAASQSVTLAVSAPTIASDNSSPVTVTAIVKDTKNNVVPSATVSFSADSGLLTVNNSGATDATGTATATLAVGPDPTVRTITVTGSAGGTNTTISVNVVGTSISLNGPGSVVAGTPSTYTVNVTEAGNKGIAGTTVTVASAAGSSLTTTTGTALTNGALKTDSTGHASFNLTASGGSSDTITVAGLGTSAAQVIAISTEQMLFTAPAAQTLVPIGGSPCTAANVPLSVKFTNGGNPVPDNTVVRFASTRGTLSASSAMTSGGVATVNICATTAGPATVTAASTPAAPLTPVSVSETFDFVSVTPSAVALLASPTTISINGQSTFTATVRDAANNLVEGQEVTFNLTDVSGGSLSTASATTDIEGTATTVYTASNSPSATNGVAVKASVASNTSINSTATITVNGSALHISFGTGNQIRENAAKTEFLQDYFLQVLDSAGNAVPNKQVNLTVHSASRPKYAYTKGGWEICGSHWVQYDGQTLGCNGANATTAPQACFNEDINLNGILDPGEDINSDNVLEPGDVASITPNPVTTGADGTTSFTVQWPEDHSFWVQVTVTATAGVSGTEGTGTTTFVLPILASYVNDINTNPPGIVSPYGVGPCTTAP